ncbi:MAG: hypothetical protein M1812_004705 [Candelaria pacifica]|nr:MAG: hypothetical protein M1812_004705 [Candelaria pacifica]
MEALAVASGVVSIVAFACKALSAIDELKRVCEEFSQDGTGQLFHDLDVTTSILLHAKELAEQVRLQGTELNLEYRAGALEIQIDDCALDLEAWLQTARRLTRPIHRAHKRPFHRILTAFTKSSRVTALDKLRWHRENIDTTLSIFGRQIDLAITRRLQRLEKTSESQSDDTKDVSKQLSNISSSISSSTNSIQAQNSETSQQLDTITRLLHQLLPKPTLPEAQQGTENDHEETGHGSRVGLLQKVDFEFELLYRVFASMTDTLRHLYTPQVSELLTTMYAWRTLEYYEVCGKLKTMPDVQCGQFDETIISRELQRLRRQVTRQLFAARKKFFSEGLGETFEDIVDSLKMKHLWSNTSLDDIFGTHSLKRQLASYQPLDPVEERKDRVTRINEWLLGVFEAYRWHFQLYHSIFNYMVRAAPFTTSQGSTYSMDISQQETFLEELKGLYFEDDKGLNRVPRLIMKYWFLDAASMLQGEIALSAVALSDSDATFRPLEEEIAGDSGHFITETAQLSTSMLREPPAEYFSLNHAASVLEEGLTGLSDSVLEEDIDQAITVLEAYRLEPFVICTGNETHKPQLPPSRNLLGAVRSRG